MTMTTGAKMEYLKSIALRYKKADRKQKTTILNEFCMNCGYHRKHAIRAINSFKRFTKPKLKKRGRHSTALIKRLQRIWLAAHLPCSKRLKAISPHLLPHKLIIIFCLPQALCFVLLLCCEDNITFISLISASHDSYNRCY